MKKNKASERLVFSLLQLNENECNTYSSFWETQAKVKIQEVNISDQIITQIKDWKMALYHHYIPGSSFDLENYFVEQEKSDG